MFNSKVIGGILLIVGTSIGGGMLALPISTAPAGFTSAAVFLIFSWLIMTLGALLILEVTLRLPPGSNMITMAKSTLGVPGQIATWGVFLMLLYTLLSAYISGGTDIFHGLLQKAHITIPNWLTSILFTFIFSLIIYAGIRTIDYVNRFLMFSKLGLYCLLLLLTYKHIDRALLHGGDFLAIRGSMMLLVTSFGFATIVPSLRDYYKSDIKTLRFVILIGSLIPLVCYLGWIAVIMGIVPKQGSQGLLSIMQSTDAISQLTNALNTLMQNAWFTTFFAIFTSICMLTAFLGVSLGLYDFLADGFKLQKSGHQGKTVLALTFLPPLTIVLVQPGIYLHALQYAGTLCVILLLLFPVMMAWQSRKLPNASAIPRLVPGGYPALIAIGVLTICLLFYAR